MAKPEGLEKIGLIVKTINQALAEEFSLRTPFNPEMTQVGERFGVFRCDAWSRVDRDRVQVESAIWLIEGFANYSDYIAGSLSLAAWLEHSVSGLKRAVIESPQKGMLANLALRDPVRIPLIASGKLNQAEQRAPWTLDIVAPCSLEILVKECP